MVALYGSRSARDTAGLYWSAMKRAAHYVALLGCLGTTHCWLFFGSDDDDFGPESQCQGCSANNEFELDPTCQLEGSLDVRLGQGADEFDAFVEGVGGRPDQHPGPQGGPGHSFIAVQVGGVDESRYDRLELTLSVLPYESCPADQNPCDPEAAANERIVLGGDPPWRMVDGNVEEYGITMFFDDVGALQARVRDPCGREGFATYRWDGI